ncbi:Lipoprotein signal peptidase [Caldalkalibacillus thermarum TA2.A1]|uniref:Lipoprotein signal peptidase n=1 Tax=Caldalkalibacillus thermarum (strain TA2.A1) TaxID=986075 RepID=F5L926_CALTT|nr:signal peptidase II [Caldalkalibacillus thermarum]EGL82200.1 Lipoprotein signal peptidase [Caldalkalibacillus thermarum TA2.A1]QZT33088.1 signal peptidase II [Caldalkalibacillus thermarum TA2.A1]
MIYFFIALVVLAVDQVTKWLVVHYMDIGQSIPLIEDVFYLTSHRNPGAAFGILPNQRLFFIVMTTVVIIGLIYYLLKVKDQKKLLSLSLALILGGALGNFIDRLLTGEVVDFLDVKITIGTFFYDYPIFNVADSALVIGVALMLIDTLRETKQNKNE